MILYHLFVVGAVVVLKLIVTEYGPVPVIEPNVVAVIDVPAVNTPGSASYATVI